VPEGVRRPALGRGGVARCPREHPTTVATPAGCATPSEEAIAREPRRVIASLTQLLRDRSTAEVAAMDADGDAEIADAGFKVYQTRLRWTP
jgi:hypothetical protein